MKRLIIILVLAVFVLPNSTATSTQKVTTIKVLPKVVMSKVKLSLLKPIRPPYWYIPENIMRVWAKVNICEMGGRWKSSGPIYSGGLGITNINWEAFGGLQFAPNAGLATPMQQVTVARRIQSSDYVPDQYGCGHGW